LILRCFLFLVSIMSVFTSYKMRKGVNEKGVNEKGVNEKMCK